MRISINMVTYKKKLSMPSCSKINDRIKGVSSKGAMDGFSDQIHLDKAKNVIYKKQLTAGVTKIKRDNLGYVAEPRQLNFFLVCRKKGLRKITERIEKETNKNILEIFLLCWKASAIFILSLVALVGSVLSAFSATSRALSHFFAL